ncbi:hypothetical protein AVEN_187403-1 [Araneus ventricosus]|uniref:RNase H type-1 domain-containing protein n=1 Tax=Araneus ventricosus TaxID=182803 RepID=A0A4Y2N4T2_ARAVE|nr:hypothetical protein AVEN_187403-1 [Araneus ventricosus]
MGWRTFCCAASHPYGKQYKAAFRKSVFPSQIPYLKGGKDKRLASSYRPISLLPTIEKVPGDTYDSDADLSFGVHQQPERPTAWLQRRQAIPTPHIGSLLHHPNGSVTNYTRHPTLTHAITVRSQVYINLSPQNPSFPNITDTQPQDLEMKAPGWSTHPSEHLKPNQISFEDEEAYIAQLDITNIFTDGWKTEHGVGAAFCVLTNNIWA